MHAVDAVGPEQVSLGVDQPPGLLDLLDAEVAGGRMARTRRPSPVGTAPIRSGLEAGESPSQLSKRLGQESGWSKREVYRRILEE